MNDLVLVDQPDRSLEQFVGARQIVLQRLTKETNQVIKGRAKNKSLENLDAV